MLIWLLIAVFVEGSVLQAARHRPRPKPIIRSAPHPRHEDGRGMHFFPMTHHFTAKVENRESLNIRRNGHQRSKQPSMTEGLSRHARVTETTDDDGVGWYHTRLAPRSGGFAVNLTFTAADGSASAWPILLDTGSANLAVATAACSTCNDSATDLSFSSPAAGASEITVMYGTSEATATW